MQPGRAMSPNANCAYSACIVSVIRVVSYKDTQLNDMTHAGVDSMTWSIVEQGIEIVCACLAITRPLFGYNRRVRRDKARDSWNSCGMRTLTPVRLRDSEDTIAWDKYFCNSTSDTDSIVTPAEVEDGQAIALPAQILRVWDANIGIAITTAPDEGKQKRFAAALPVIEEELRPEEYIVPMSADS